MPLHLPTFFTRLGSAVVFAAVMMAGLLWNEWSFLALVALIQVLCLRDYFRLMGKIAPMENRKTMHALAQVFGLLLLAGVFIVVGGDFHPSCLIPTWHESLRSNYLTEGRTLAPTNYLPVIWPALLFVPCLMLLAGILSPKGNLQSASYSVMSLLYIVLPCTLLIALGAFNKFLPLVLILCIWMNDTMAYLVGSFIGKTPFSKISPKKTWEGTAGGAILTIAGAAITAWLLSHDNWVRMAAYIGIALCAAVAGTAGDLLESKLKRLAGVKDSGTMMPGHGGALDRFDSLLVATPFAFAWIYLLNLAG